MQLFCSTKSNVAVAVPEGTWVQGKFELPAGISQLTRGLERIEDGDCQLPNGRTVRLEQKRLPYRTHACGADPGGVFSLTLDKTPIYPETDYCYCHRGYLILAVVINEGSVQTCTWRTGDLEPTTGVTYLDAYKCQDDSLRLPTP